MLINFAYELDVLETLFNYLLTYLLTYLFIFDRWQHRPSTMERHIFLSVAIFTISLLVYPVSFVSLSVSLSRCFMVYLFASSLGGSMWLLVYGDSWVYVLSTSIFASLLHFLWVVAWSLSRLLGWLPCLSFRLFTSMFKLVMNMFNMYVLQCIVYASERNYLQIYGALQNNNNYY